MIKCIIFDCDGTLVDSELLFNNALSVKLKEQGINLTAAELVSRFRGVKLTEILAEIESEYSILLDEVFIEDYRLLVNEFFEQELVACRGVPETLSQLETAMCVATNGPLEKMQLALSVTNLAHYFGDNLFSAYEVGAWKPDPQLFLFSATKMGFKAHECLVVEDSVVGVEAAKAANMRAVLYDPHHVHLELEGVVKIHTFQEVLRQLN